MYLHVAPCLPSPCINNGTCIAVNAADQLQCNCKEMYFGTFCEKIDKVCMYILCLDTLCISAYYWKVILN